MKQFCIVLKFEYLNYVRSKTFLITTAVFLAIILLLGSLPGLMGIIQGIGGSLGSEREESGKQALFTDASGLYTPQLLKEYLPGYDWSEVESLEGVEQAIEAEEYALALALNGLEITMYRRGSESMFTSYSGLEELAKTLHQQEMLAEAGLDGEQIDAVLHAQPVIQAVIVGKDLSQSYWISYALLMMLYMATILYGQYVTMSVVTEKSSKAMELLITSAKPVSLMFGKVIGAGLAGLTQFGAIIAATLATILVGRGAWEQFSPAVTAVFDLSLSSNVFVFAIIYFLLGFFSFAFIYAAMGSTASRMEDANASQMIPMLLFVGVFLVAISGLGMPEAGYIKVCSYLPFFSPLIMFLRISTTQVPPLSIVLSIVLNLVYIFAAGFVSAKIYRVGVMLYGKRPTIKELCSYIAKA